MEIVVRCRLLIRSWCNRAAELTVYFIIELMNCREQLEV